MKKALLLLSLFLIVISCRQSENKHSAKLTIKPVDIQIINKGNIEFSKYFLDKTMRLDYFHSGTSTEEHFATDRIVSDGIWGGSKKILVDDLRLGLYFFEVIDKASNILLYSRKSVHSKEQDTLPKDYIALRSTVLCIPGTLSSVKFATGGLRK